tara:strand:+ start:100491 stop:100682 length:192 start_codon:yes stop_codon:yes gene_type:complete
LPSAIAAIWCRWAIPLLRCDSCSPLCKAIWAMMVYLHRGYIPLEPMPLPSRRCVNSRACRWMD